MPQGRNQRGNLFITLLGGAAAWPLAVRAQQTRVYTIGVLTLASPNPEPLLTALREGLRDAGYVEGRNLHLEIRSAAGRPDLQLEKAAELVHLKVDLIITFFTPTALAAKKATREIPIVMAGASDPVAAGLVASLARPGGNVRQKAKLDLIAFGHASWCHGGASASAAPVRSAFPIHRRCGARRWRIGAAAR